MAGTSDIQGKGDIPSIMAEMYAYADEVMARVGWPEAELKVEYHRHLTMLLSQGYVHTFGTRVEGPDLVPHTGALFPWGAPNHDTLYTFAPVDKDGVYRICGRKGDETISSVMLRRNGPNTGQIHGAPIGEFDVPDMPADADGNFSFILSLEKPAGYDGHWVAMNPETTGLVTRHVTTQAAQQDGTWSIERLDRAPAPVRLGDDEVLRSMRNAASFASKLSEFLMNLVKGMRDRGVNRLEPERYASTGGLQHQLYLQGAFELADDEALILESEVPETCFYWSVQLLDPFFAGIDPVVHQSSLNGDQVGVDPDGKVRLVISARDPGVANWLDTGGWGKGAMIWRWHSASSYPIPTLRAVKFADLDKEIPAGARRLDAEGRKAARGARIRHYQHRRRW